MENLVVVSGIASKAMARVLSEPEIAIVCISLSTTAFFCGTVVGLMIPRRHDG